VAGLTILFALLLTMFISYFILGFVLPQTSKNLMSFCILAFMIGYIIDKVIYIEHIFGNRLNAYYKEYGAGFWGATAFLFSIIISYSIQKIILKSI
jgi:Cu/Ag efflux pump CusA